MLSLSALQAIMPFARQRAVIYLGPLNATMIEFEINTPMRQAPFLAQLAWESGELKYVEELASGEDYDDRVDLGNTEPDAIRIARLHDSTPGAWWKGHGLIQTTGFYNHRSCGVRLSLDLLNNPTLLCEPVNAARSSGFFWRNHGLNVLADHGDFARITKVINGGYKTLPQRTAYWERAKRVLDDVTAKESSNG